MECLVYIEKKVRVAEKRALQKIVLSALQTQKQAGAVSVHLIGEKKMKALNRQWRRKKKVTDVLAFAANEGEGIAPQGKELDWGDIFICLPRIKRQAQEFKVSYQEELKRIVVHGLLHLLGYVHEQPVEAKKMFSLQEKLVQCCQQHL